MLSIVQWFGPPQLQRVDLRERARALWIVSWPFFAVVVVLLVAKSFIDPSTASRRTITGLATGVLMVILHATSRSGRPVQASWILVLGLSALITQRAWITGGIHATVEVFYLIFIVIAGVLLGKRGALVTAAVCFCGAVILAVGTAAGWLTSPPGAESALGAFVYVVSVIGFALLLSMLLNRRSARASVDADALHLVVGDMRSPMQVTVAHLQALRSELRDERAQDVEAALDGVWSLSRITNTLLDVTRLESGCMPIRPALTDLGTLSHTVVADAYSDKVTCHIVVETSGDVACNCDPYLMRRVLENLVENGVHVTPADGRVRVDVRGSETCVRVAVTDEGGVIPPDARARIFEPYARDRAHRGAAEESSGLPLAFCRLVVEAHGGTIRIEDGGTRGSTFVVELPR